jgi:exonuclease III
MASPMILLPKMKCQDAFFSWFRTSMIEFRRESGDKIDTFQMTRRLGDRCKMDCKKTRKIHLGGVPV